VNRRREQLFDLAFTFLLWFGGVSALLAVGLLIGLVASRLLPK